MIIQDMITGVRQSSRNHGSDLHRMIQVHIRTRSPDLQSGDIRKVFADLLPVRKLLQRLSAD